MEKIIFVCIGVAIVSRSRSCPPRRLPISVVEVVPSVVSRCALGADADAVLPDGVRLTDLHVRLPRHQVAMLAAFAERDRTTVSDVLARELDGVASAHADELSWRVAGFAEALSWPDAESTQLPC